MAIRAQYTKPLQIVATPQMKAACKKKADAEGISLAAVYRRLLQKGLAVEASGN